MLDMDTMCKFILCKGEACNSIMRFLAYITYLSEEAADISETSGLADGPGRCFAGVEDSRLVFKRAGFWTDFDKKLKKKP